MATAHATLFAPVLLQLRSNGWRTQGPVMLGARYTTSPLPPRQKQQQLPYAR